MCRNNLIVYQESIIYSLSVEAHLVFNDDNSKLVKLINGKHVLGLVLFAHLFANKMGTPNT